MDNNYTVTNHEYTNTGGNCMVSVFTVYDHSARCVRYVACDDERLNFMTFDTIHNEPPAELDYDDCIIESYTYDLLVTDPCFDNPVATISEEKFLLFKNCQFEHYKKDCKYLGIRVELSIEELPGELYNELGMDAIEWHHKNGDLVTTDGYHVWPSEGYEPNEYSRSILDFKQFIDDTVNEAFTNYSVEKLYDKPITLVFNGRAVQLQFAAAEYNAIGDALKQIIDAQ